MNKLTLIFSSAAIALAGGLAHAQTQSEGAQGDMPGMDGGMEGMSGGMEGMDMSSMPAHVQGFMGAMDTMMQGMPKDTSGDPGLDYLQMMIPYHQYGIDLARVALEQGDSPEVQAVAEEAIAAHEAEIARLQSLLGSVSQ